MYINFWYAAEQSANVTDKPVGVRMLGQDFVLFRDSSGDAHCLSNVCVHRGGSLAGGSVKGDCVQCPYHGWQFDGEGRCQKIPSLGADARIPGRAKVDAYPVEERYGIIFAFLGDLPEDQRPDIMNIPEYEQEGWRATYEDRISEIDYRRLLENSLDPAHNEYVHPTHGFSGARDDYFVPTLDVQETEWGSGFLTTYLAPPLKDKKMKAATGRSEDAVIHAGTFHHGPSTLCTSIHPTAESTLRQNGFLTPVDEQYTRTFLVQMRNFLLTEDTDHRFHERNDVVAGQDRVVLGDINPPITPETRSHEFFVPADKAIARYRDYLDEWQAMGWRIDVDALVRAGQKAAFSIPSPGRREHPKGWVLDAVPLMAATAAPGVTKAGAA